MYGVDTGVGLPPPGGVLRSGTARTRTDARRGYVVPRHGHRPYRRGGDPTPRTHRRRHRMPYRADRPVACRGRLKEGRTIGRTTASQDLGHRYRVPGRHARRVHGRARLRCARHRRRPEQDRHPFRRPGPVLRAGARRGPDPQPRERAAALHDRLHRGRRVRRCALHLRGHPPARRLRRRRPDLRQRRHRQPGPPADPALRGHRQVHRPGGHRRERRRPAGRALPPPGTASSWAGARSSCARASACRTP